MLNHNLSKRIRDTKASQSDEVATTAQQLYSAAEESACGSLLPSLDCGKCGLRGNLGKDGFGGQATKEGTRRTVKCKTNNCEAKAYFIKRLEAALENHLSSEMEARSLYEELVGLLAKVKQEKEESVARAKARKTDDSDQDSGSENGSISSGGKERRSKGLLDRSVSKADLRPNQEAQEGSSTTKAPRKPKRGFTDVEQVTPSTAIKNHDEGRKKIVLLRRAEDVSESARVITFDEEVDVPMGECSTPPPEDLDAADQTMRERNDSSSTDGETVVEDEKENTTMFTVNTIEKKDEEASDDDLLKGGPYFENEYYAEDCHGEIGGIPGFDEEEDEFRATGVIDIGELYNELQEATDVESLKACLGGVFQFIQNINEETIRKNRRIQEQEKRIQKMNQKAKKDEATILNLQERVFNLTAELTKVHDTTKPMDDASKDQQHSKKEEGAEEKKEDPEKKNTQDRRNRDVRGKKGRANAKFDALFEDESKMNETFNSLLKKPKTREEAIVFEKLSIKLNTKAMINNGTITKSVHLKKLTTELMKKLAVYEKVSLTRLRGLSEMIIHFPAQYKAEIITALTNGGADFTLLEGTQEVNEQSKAAVATSLAYSLLRATTINLRSCILEGFTEDIQEAARMKYEDLKSSRSSRASPRL
jgi:hypothetical protein